MRTVKEKYEYNKQKLDSNFSVGYVLGVQAYTDYGKATADCRAGIRESNKRFAASAKTEKDEFSIGYMCALRDCARERKKK